MQRRLETLKNTEIYARKGTWKSAIVDHQWYQQHQVGWNGTRVLDGATRPIQLKGKEALHIERIPANTRLNCDGDYELLYCWIVTMKKLRGGANCTSTNHVGVSASTSAPICMGAQVHETRL